MKKSKIYEVIKKTLMIELRKIFLLKGKGLCEEYVEAKKLGIKFDESIFDRYKSTHQTR